MRRFFVVLGIVLCLLALGCSKKNPTGASQTFVLEVDNRTVITFDIHVNGSFAGVSEANTKKELGSFEQGKDTHIEVVFNDVTIYEVFQNTMGASKYTLVIAM